MPSFETTGGENLAEADFERDRAIIAAQAGRLKKLEEKFPPELIAGLRKYL